jgi:hypothetical protein
MAASDHLQYDQIGNLEMGPVARSRSLMNAKKIPNTLPQQESLGGRARGGDKVPGMMSEINTPQDVDRQWHDVKAAWGGDKAAYDRWTGRNLR